MRQGAGFSFDEPRPSRRECTGEPTYGCEPGESIALYDLTVHIGAGPPVRREMVRASACRSPQRHGWRPQRSMCTSMNRVPVRDAVRCDRGLDLRLGRHRVEQRDLIRADRLAGLRPGLARFQLRCRRAACSFFDLHSVRNLSQAAAPASSLDDRPCTRAPG
jgi:hypothetical protein